MDTRQLEGMQATFRLPEFYRRNAHLFASEESIRWYLRNRHINGLIESGAVLEVRLRPTQKRPQIRIVEPAWFDWMRGNGQLGFGGGA